MTKAKTTTPETASVAPIHPIYRNGPSILDERTENLHVASKAYRARVQAEAAAERAKPSAPYDVGRAALDVAMQSLGEARFHAASDAATAEPAE